MPGPSIPSGHRAKEFYLCLSWKPDGSRSSTIERPVPGFYLYGTFANEGAATAVVPGSWKGGRGGPGTLVPAGFLADLLELMADHGLLDDRYQHDKLAADLNTAARDSQQARLNALRASIARAQADIAEAEQALRDAGVSVS